MAAPGGLTPGGDRTALALAERDDAADHATADHAVGAVAPAGSGRHRALIADRARTGVDPGHDARSRRTGRALAAAGAVCLLGGLTMLGPGPGSHVAALDPPAGRAVLRVPDPLALHRAAPVGAGVLARLAAGEPPEPPARAGTPPVELVLPARDLRAPVVAVATGPEGTLLLPEPPSTVGWWSPSALAGGAAGTTVLAGHVDSLAGGLGALAVLRQVAEGEEIVLRGADGRTVGYRVTGRHQYAKAELPPEVFAAGGPPRLVLITCGGAFDRRTRHYADNVVVFAEPT